MKYLFSIGLVTLTAVASAQNVTFVENLNLNTDKAEYAPTLDKEGQLVFVSNRNPAAGVVRYDKDNNTSFYDLYRVSKKLKRNKSSKVEPLNKNLNSKYHEGPISFDYENKIAYFTTNNVIKNKKIKAKDGFIKLQIFSAAINDDGSFGSLVPFKYNNDDYSCGHPTLSKDGNTMIFSSDMPGGFGGSDLYITWKSNGEWKQPKNLGKGVNSTYSELYPFLSDKNELYFSSNNEQSKGGLDIFVSKPTASYSYKTFAPLEGIINSEKDDFGFIIDLKSEDLQGYYTSNKDGGKGDDDIYHWVGENEFFILSGKVLDQDGNPILGAIVNATDSEGEVVKTTTDENGDYKLSLDRNQKNYQVGVEANNQFPFNQEITDFGKDKYDFKLEEFPYLSGSVIDSKTGQPIPGVKIAVYDNLLKEKKDFDTKEDGSIYAPITGHEKGTKLDYKISLKRDGYLATSMRYKDILDHGGAFEIFMDPVELTEVKKGLDIGKVFDLKPIYYEYNKYEITAEAAKELDKIVIAMQENPTLIIELGSHTDARGGSSFNKKLSDKRAKSAAEYVRSRITDKTRIKGKGYGKEQLLNDCKGDECSEEQHAINRRTEFKIVKY